MSSHKVKEVNNTELYSKLCLILRRNKNSKGGEIANKLLEEICKINQDNFDYLINLNQPKFLKIKDQSFNEQNIPINKPFNEFNSQNILNLIGKLSYVDNQNITLILKEKMIVLLINSIFSLYYNKCELNFDLKDTNELQVLNLIKSKKINKNEGGNKILQFIKDKTNVINSNPYQETLTKLESFFDKLETKVGYREFYDQISFNFNDLIIPLEDNRSLDIHFTNEIDNKKIKVKENIAKNRLEINQCKNSIENIKLSLDKISSQKTQLLEMEKGLELDGSMNKKVNDTTIDDVVKMIADEKKELDNKESVIKLRLDIFASEINYLNSIIEYQDNQCACLSNNKDTIKLLLNSIILEVMEIFINHFIIKS